MARNTPAGLIPVGFQTISLANSTALGLNTTCITGHTFHFSVETQNIRYRDDGTNPALTTGVLLASGAAYWLLDIDPTKLKFQRQTGTAKISLMAYRNR